MASRSQDGLHSFILFFHIPHQVQFSCALAFLIPHRQVLMASLYSSQLTCPCFESLYAPFFALSMPSRSLLSYASFLPPLPTFLFRGTESSCAFRKASLKSSQLSSTSLSLGTASQGIWANNSLNSLKFALPKFRVLTPLFARPTFLEITNLTRAWSLQPWRPPTFNDLKKSYLKSCKSDFHRV